MKTYQGVIVTCCLIFAMLSCNQKQDQRNEMTANDNSPAGIISSSASLENGKDSTRKFIRSADLKFKAESVVQSTYDIEDIATRQGGFVTVTNLTSVINSFTSVAVDADSSVETTGYAVTNAMTIRVPNTRLDTTLKEISKNILYLDYRIINARDVALQLLSNKLTQVRSVKSENRLIKAIDSKGRRLYETTIAEEALVDKQQQNDDASISNLSLNDQINFSTINLSIYQKPVIEKKLVLTTKLVEPYETGFGSKLVESLKYGWNILAKFLVFLTKLWALFLCSVLVYFVYNSYKPKLR